MSVTRSTSTLLVVEVTVIKLKCDRQVCSLVPGVQIVGSGAKKKEARKNKSSPQSPSTFHRYLYFAPLSTI